MNDEQQHEEQQEVQQEAQGLLRSERKARGELRNTNLQAGRKQARRDNALARKRNATEPALPR
jgi:hypothetical protein